MSFNEQIVSNYHANKLKYEDFTKEAPQTSYTEIKILLNKVSHMK